MAGRVVKVGYCAFGAQAEEADPGKRRDPRRIIDCVAFSGIRSGLLCAVNAACGFGHGIQARLANILTAALAGTIGALADTLQC